MIYVRYAIASWPLFTGVVRLWALTSSLEGLTVYIACCQLSKLDRDSKRYGTYSGNSSATQETSSSSSDGTTTILSWGVTLPKGAGCLSVQSSHGILTFAKFSGWYVAALSARTRPMIMKPSRSAVPTNTLNRIRHFIFQGVLQPRLVTNDLVDVEM